MFEHQEIILGIYTEDDNREALELEEKCIQGTSYQMSFKRSTFHRRAQNFSDWKIFTARWKNKLVGVIAVAIKEVVLFNNNEKAAFFFDARVHPSFRGRGIATVLTQRAMEWARYRSNIQYTYSISDNRIIEKIAKRIEGYSAGKYSYLVYPVYRLKKKNYNVSNAGFKEVHDTMLKVSPPFDFYTFPDFDLKKSGYMTSWIIRHGKHLAGCSAWNNREILGEVIESLPLIIQTAKSITNIWPVNKIPLPHIPAPGEELRSWYLFDFFSTDPNLARDLMRHIAREAMDNNIDYCYIPHNPTEPWVKAISSDIPKMFSPDIRYTFILKKKNGINRPVNRLYLDIRDL
jgi:GNAT superfamily N-acetyltransferase